VCRNPQVINRSSLRGVRRGDWFSGARQGRSECFIFVAAFESQLVELRGVPSSKLIDRQFTDAAQRTKKISPDSGLAPFLRRCRGATACYCDSTGFKSGAVRGSRTARSHSAGATLSAGKREAIASNTPSRRISAWKRAAATCIRITAKNAKAR
jgi:hypothetical protein